MNRQTLIGRLRAEAAAIIALLPLAIAILIILTQWPLSDVTFIYADL